ncbi:hypothetical protein HLB23_33685 [Nocardia uniformis]|uniref:Clp R domain-containing protein n=1 Tax=Nocardia uniformis TaxID=53432 RepID=A0A849CA73_9NOCA|nr:hypothetical protein [Nocardia uniformis]NNH74746.1 hypothetical protein [Nocardia uniformis]
MTTVPPAASDSTSEPPRDVCSPELLRLLDDALAVADSGGAEQVGIEHIVMAMLLHARNIPVRALLDLRLDPSVVFSRLTEFARREVDAQTLTN